MSSAAQVAGSIIKFCEDQTVVDYLFTRAKENIYLGETPPSREMGLKYFKKSLPHCLAVAGHAKTDPEVLAKYAKDPRVSVREALMRNTGLPLVELKDLGLWAAERKDGASLKFAFTRLCGSDCLDVLESQPKHIRVHSYHIPTDALCEQVRKDKEQTLRAIRLGHQQTCILLATFAHHGECAASLTEIINMMKEDLRGPILDELTTDDGYLSVELAGLLATYEGSLRYGLFSKEEPFALVEPGAAEALGCGRTLINTAITSGLSDALLIRYLKEANFNDMFRVLKAMNEKEISVKAERTLIEKFVELGGEEGLTSMDPDSRNVFLKAGDILANLKHDHGDLILKLLQAGGIESSTRWLTDEELVNKPKPGQITRLLDRPENAFLRLLKNYQTRQFVADRPKDKDAIIEKLAYNLVSLGDRDDNLKDELTDLLDNWLGGNIGNYGCGALAARRAEQELGSDMKRWETFTTLGSEWTGSLSSLLDAAKQLS